MAFDLRLRNIFSYARMTFGIEVRRLSMHTYVLLRIIIIIFEYQPRRSYQNRFFSSFFLLTALQYSLCRTLVSIRCRNWHAIWNAFVSGWQLFPAAELLTTSYGGDNSSLCGGCHSRCG